MGARDDDELALCAERGDRAAWSTLIRRHLGQVWGLALYHVGDPVEAADLARKVFVKALSDLTRLPDPRKLRSWLQGIALAMIRESRGAGATTSAGVEGALEGVLSLPPNLRKPLELRYFQGLSYSAISSLTGMSPDGVDRILRRAKQMAQRASET